MTNLLRILHYLSQAMRRLHWTENRLRQYQEKKLRSVINYAYHNVPFYHRKMKENKLSPDSIRRLEDLSKLPLIRKDEMRRHARDDLISRECPVEGLKVVRTSGSTGKPFFVYLNDKEDAWRKAIYIRANVSCGQRPRDKWVVISAPHHFSEITNLQRRFGVFARQGISIFLDAEQQLKILQAVNPDILDGYSNTIARLGRLIERTGIRGIRPKIVFGTAELIDPSSQANIEKAFGAPFYDQFGCAELDRTGWQCPVKNGYHMDVDSVITELVDKEGNNVASGEQGEVVYTSLFNYSMPIIRYAIGDIAIARADKCSCGRILPLMKVVEGRKDAFITFPDGRQISPRLMTVALLSFEDYEKIEQFRIVQRKKEKLDIYLRLKTTTDTRSLSNNLTRHFQKLLKVQSDEVQFEISFVDEIPTFSRDSIGKLQAVFSEVN
jgi:phenylacetate-CoA ligase